MNTPDTTSSTPAWTDPLLKSPHTVADKADRVNKMFSAIAPSYDLNNRLHSLWMDQHWRSVAVKMANVQPNDRIVDVACGTGDLTLKFFSALARLRGSQRPLVIGIDFTYEMLPIARKKAESKRCHLTEEDFAAFPGSDIDPGWYSMHTKFLQGDALSLPLPSQSADIISIAFGIRNVSNWGNAIDEFARVLRPGGRLIILEFSLPSNPVLKAFYNFYFRKIMPRTATFISGDKSGAYKYLPESVNTFISRDAMRQRMGQAGFTDILAKPLTFGICVCYKGVKKA